MMPTPTITSARTKLEVFIPRPFSRQSLGAQKESAGAQLWVDTVLFESDSLELMHEDMPRDEVGIELYVPASKLDRSKVLPVYQNIRLETGRGGVWITPIFVVGLYASSSIPGFVFIRLAERVGNWIKVQGTLAEVSQKLGISLTMPKKTATKASAKPAARRQLAAR